MTLQRLICFDFGEKRIGVATGQTLTSTATPLETVSASRGRPDWKRIEALIKEWRPDAVVIGLPLQMDGGTQDLTGAADRFGRAVERRFGLPVYHVDERLTTYEAQRRGARPDVVDAVAAQVILESWLADHGAGEARDAP